MKMIWQSKVHYSIDMPYKALTIEGIAAKIYAVPPMIIILSVEEHHATCMMPWQRQMMMSYLLPRITKTQLSELTDYAMSFAERNEYHLMNT